MSKITTKYTVKSIQAMSNEQIETLTLSETRAAYRVMQQAMNKRLKAMEAQNIYSSAVISKFGSKRNTKSPRFKPFGAFAPREIKNQLKEITRFSLLKTATIKGAKTTEKEVAQKFSERIGKPVSALEVREMFAVIPDLETIIPEAQFLDGSDLVEMMFEYRDYSGQYGLDIDELTQALINEVDRREAELYSKPTSPRFTMKK